MAAPTTSNHVTGPSFSSSSSSLPSYYPDFYNFPPFYTRQPNASTWASQLSQWRTFILEYCRHHNLWKLNITEAQNTDLFYNKTIDRKLPLPAIREIFQSLISTDNAEAVASASSSSTGAASAATAALLPLLSSYARDKDKDNENIETYNIFWRTPEYWATVIQAYIESTGQKNTVLTLFELTEGDQADGMEWYGIDQGMMKRCLDVLVKRGIAGMFSVGDEWGVKFY